MITYTCLLATATTTAILFFFLNDPPPTEIYPLSLHDALPIVLVTRPREQAGEFADLLAGYGARVLTMPAIAIVPPADWRPPDRAIGDLPRDDWGIFSSVNGVRVFFQRLRALPPGARALGRAP